MTSNFTDLDRETPTSHPWGDGLFTPILVSLGVSLVVLVLRAVQRIGEFEGEFAEVLFTEITANLTILSAIFSTLVLLVYVFAYIRRQDPARSRYAGIAGRGEWLIVATLVVGALTSAITTS